jgi:hypothetical protein
MSCYALHTSCYACASRAPSRRLFLFVSFGERWQVGFCCTSRLHRRQVHHEQTIQAGRSVADGKSCLCTADMHPAPAQRLASPQPIALVEDIKPDRVWTLKELEILHDMALSHECSLSIMPTGTTLKPLIRYDRARDHGLIPNNCRSDH